MNITQHIKNMVKKLPGFFVARNIMRNITGHYYSPLPSLKEIADRKEEIFTKKLPLGVDLNVERQIEKLRLFSEMMDTPPFYSEKKRIRYNIDNPSFTYDDAPVLHCMMRLLSPSRIIEIGSGNSSACMLDINDLYLHGAVRFTFIDILFRDLKEMLRPDDYKNITLIESKIQDVDPKMFKALKANDILFIDSSHIMKTGSDVHTILFNILPALNSGVYVHFHDIRYPFEYMLEDMEKRVFWNEAYTLRAFLQYNSSFEISFWLNCLLNAERPEVKELISFLPLDRWAAKFGRYVHVDQSPADTYKNAGGSIWLKKVNAD